MIEDKLVLVSTNPTATKKLGRNYESAHRGWNVRPGHARAEPYHPAYVVYSLDIDQDIVCTTPGELHEIAATEDED